MTRSPGGLRSAAVEQSRDRDPAASGLVVTGMQCWYASQQVIWEADLTVPAGDGVAIVGRNGVGKTTLLRGVMNAFGARSTGSVVLDGKEIADWRPDQIARSGVGFVPDDRRMLPLSVLENLKLGARNKAAWTENLERVVSYFPLIKDRLKQRADTMSGGEQQAVAIARALMSDPRYLLLDEPAEGLAPALVDQLIEALVAIRNETGIGILLVDRNAALISNLSSVVIGLSKGRVRHRTTSAEFASSEAVRVKFLAPSHEESDSEEVGQ
jgi:branched-chain amino acid transport system ATP-binding protein